MASTTPGSCSRSGPCPPSAAEREAPLSEPDPGARPSVTPEPPAAEPGQPGRSGAEPGQPGRSGAEPGRAAAFDVVLLAGGRGSRLGGADKPGLAVRGRTLLSSVVSAASSAGARRIIVVGPGRPDLPGGLMFVREEPPGSGPVPALRRGLAEVSAPTVALLAADLPFLRARHLRMLLTALPGAAARPRGPGRAVPGVVMLDDTGRPQWLASCWRTAVLRAAAVAYAGRSLHGLLSPLEPARLDPAGPDPAGPGPAGLGYALAAGEPPPWLDCDTPDDLARARAWPGATGHET